MDKQEESAKVKAVQRNMKVIVVQRIGANAQVVQWVEGDLPRRALVPVQDTYTQDDLDAGLPKSIDWASEITLKANSKALALNLYKRDIWTVNDAKNRTNAVISALMETYGADLTAIVSIAQNKEADNA